MPKASPTAPAGFTVGSTTYGADESGLICGYVFAPSRPGEAIDSAQAAERLLALRAAPDSAALEHEGHFMWLHFNLSHASAERWLARHAELPETFFETLHEGSHSTRIERAEQALVAVVNDVHFDFSFEPADISTLWISVDSCLVVTARQSPLRSVDALRQSIRSGEAMRSPVELLERLLRTQADVLVDIVRGVTKRIDGIEDQLLAGRRDTRRARLGLLRRLLVRLQRLLAPEPAALFRLLQRPPAWMAERDADELREATEEFSVVLRDMAALQERIKLLQEEIAAAVNEDNNRSLFVLTIVTVLALPINILAGLFGMNVGGVPLADNPHGFWVIVLVVAAFTAVAGWLAFRKKRDG